MCLLLFVVFVGGLSVDFLSVVVCLSLVTGCTTSRFAWYTYIYSCNKLFNYSSQIKNSIIG